MSDAKKANPHKLLVLMGTTGAGKSSVTKELSKVGYISLSFDEVIKEMYPGKDNLKLTQDEIVEAYGKLGEEASKLLKRSHVVVDEWFYIEGSFDWFRSKLDDLNKEDIFFFQLDADLDSIIARHSHEGFHTPREIVEKHYKLTHEKPGRYYIEYKPILIDTTDTSPTNAAQMIIAHVALSEYVKITRQHDGYQR